jgi:hypothetical protein
MPKTALLLLAFAAALSACDDKPKNPPPQTAREDNPLLKYQDETVNKAKEKIEAGLQQTQQQLDAVDKQ